MSNYNEFRHKKFMEVFTYLINNAETTEERSRVFVILDYINHLNQRITKLEEGVLSD